MLAGVELWNTRHPAFRIDRRLVEQNVYAPFDGLDASAWGHYDGDDLMGFALAKTLTRPVDDYVGPEYGWISLLAVASDADDPRTVGRQALDAAETGLAATGVETVRFGGDPGNFLPGLPSGLDDAYAGTLASAGYERGRTFFDLARDVSSFEPPERVKRVRTCDPDFTVERVGRTRSPNCLGSSTPSFPAAGSTRPRTSSVGPAAPTTTGSSETPGPRSGSPGRTRRRRGTAAPTRTGGGDSVTTTVVSDRWASTRSTAVEDGGCTC